MSLASKKQLVREKLEQDGTLQITRAHAYHLFQIMFKCFMEEKNFER